jgi:hypothetical protein
MEKIHKSTKLVGGDCVEIRMDKKYCDIQVEKVVRTKTFCRITGRHLDGDLLISSTSSFHQLFNYMGIAINPKRYHGEQPTGRSIVIKLYYRSHKMIGFKLNEKESAVAYL